MLSNDLVGVYIIHRVDIKKLYRIHIIISHKFMIKTRRHQLVQTLDIQFTAITSKYLRLNAHLLDYSMLP